MDTPEAPDFTYELTFNEEGLVTDVSGITEEMEFRKVGLDEWKTGSINEAGSYEIRYKATQTSFPSISYVVTFEDKEKEQEAEESPKPEEPKEKDEPKETVQNFDVETQVSCKDNYINLIYNNTTNGVISGQLIFALYDDNNNLIEIRLMKNGEFRAGTSSVGFKYYGENTVGSVKFFAWDSLNTLKPVSGVQASSWINQGGI